MYRNTALKWTCVTGDLSCKIFCNKAWWSDVVAMDVATWRAPDHEVSGSLFVSWVSDQMSDDGQGSQWVKPETNHTKWLPFIRLNHFGESALFALTRKWHMIWEIFWWFLKFNQVQWQIDNWMQMFVLVLSDTRVVTPESWQDDRDTLTHQSAWWDVRCSMFPCLCCDLWRCSCWLCTLYSLLHRSQHSGPRSKIHLEQQQQRRPGPECPWHRRPGSSARPRPRPADTDNTPPQTVQRIHKSTLFPVLTLYQRTWGTLTHSCRKGSHAAFEPYLRLSDDESETLIMQSRMSLSYLGCQHAK